MDAFQARPAHAAFLLAPLGLSASARRRMASLSPVAATMLLTAAIFLLPATGEQPHARASADDINVSATHMQHDAGLTVRE